MDSSLNFVDDLTLQTFMNKSNYDKYLMKNNDQKYKEKLEYKNKLSSFKTSIIKIFNDYIDNPDLQISYELDDMFSQFSKSCIKHLEFEHLLEHKDDQFESNEKDEDTLFDKIDNDNVPPPPQVMDKIHTLWGKAPIKK